MGPKLCFAVTGLYLGIFMAATHKHAQYVTYTGFLLVGRVLSLIYEVIHKLWLRHYSTAVAKVQWIAHHAASLALFTGLFCITEKSYHWPC